MRIRACGWAAMFAVFSVACGGGDEPAPADEPAMIAPPGVTKPAGPAGGQAPPDPPWNPSVATHPEVVYVLGAGWDGRTWFCTGALVSRSVVVTAAHCLQSSLVKSWQVAAPAANGAQKVAASKVKQYDGGMFDDPARPDLGILVLDGGIDLPQYAVLTDVSASVEAGKSASVAAVVRTADKPQAPLMKTAVMELSSTVPFGYDHGYGVPMYSHGGDSGAGLFLIEKGQMTHKLVGAERQPEPARQLDHLSRIEPAFIRWVAANGT